MNRRLEEALRRIEAALRARRAATLPRRDRGPVLVVLDGESHEQAVERAAAEGRHGPFLAVPEMLPVEEWARRCGRYQAWLLARCGVDRDGPTAQEFAAASAAARGHGPMPT